MTHNEYKSVSWLTMNPSQLSPALFWTDLPQKVFLSFGRYCSDEVAWPPDSLSWKPFASWEVSARIGVVLHQGMLSPWPDKLLQQLLVALTPVSRRPSL